MTLLHFFECDVCGTGAPCTLVTDMSEVPENCPYSNWRIAEWQKTETREVSDE